MTIDPIWLGHTPTEPRSDLDALWDRSPTIEQISPLLTGYAQVAGETHVVDTSFPVGDVRRYGAVMDGSVSSADYDGFMFAYENAIRLRAAVLRLPIGTLRPDQRLAFSIPGPTTTGEPNGLIITGYGRMTVIRPGASVTTGMSIAGDLNTDGEGNSPLLRDFTIDMRDTTDAVGLLAGENGGVPSGYLEFDNIKVIRAGGGAGVGLQVKDVVGLRVTGCMFGRSDYNLLVRSSVNSLPTAIVFDGNTRFRLAGINNARIENVIKASFLDVVFENAVQEGVYVTLPAANNALMVQFVRCWFESNYAAGTDCFQLRVDDGATLGTANCMAVDCYWAGAAKSAWFKNVANLVVRNPTVIGDQAGSFRWDVGGRSGEWTEWPENNLDFDTRVEILNPNYRAIFPRRLFPDLSQIPAGTSPAAANHFAIDVFKGDLHEIDLVGLTTTAWTVDNPLHLDQRSPELTYFVKNLTGGTVTTPLAFGAMYVLNETWVNPTAGNLRVIKFRYDVNSAKMRQIGLSTTQAN